MNVLFPFVGDSVGGSHWSAINLFIELKKNKLINPKIVLHVAHGPLSKHLDEMNIDYDLLPLSCLAGQNSGLLNISFRMISNLLPIFRYIKNNDLSIVHGNDLRINLTWSLPVKLSNAKYVWHQRTILSNSVKWHAIYYLSDFVVSISSFVHKSLPNNLTKWSSVCVKNPFDTKTIYNKNKSRYDINTKYHFLKNVFLIGYVGRLVPWKHIDDILYALHNIVNCTENTHKVHLIIVGSGDTYYTSKINNIISSLKIEEYVTMTGFSSNPSLIISALDLLIASSYNEPFGRVVVESMIQKTPVLACRSGGHVESIEHNNTGLLYDESDPNMLLSYMLRIISKDINTDFMVDAAYCNATLEYSSTMHADAIISIYRKLG